MWLQKFIIIFIFFVLTDIIVSRKSAKSANWHTLEIRRWRAFLYTLFSTMALTNNFGGRFFFLSVPLFLFFNLFWVPKISKTQDSAQL